MAVVWQGKAAALAGLKRYEEALAAYDHYLSTTTPTRALLQQKARLLRKLGRVAEAKAVEKQAKHL